MGSLKRSMLGILLVVLAIPMAGIAFGDFREIEEYLVDGATRFPWSAMKTASCF